MSSQSIEEAVRAHLLDAAAVAAIVGVRIHPAPLRREVELPAVAYQRVSTARGRTQSGADGFGAARVQLSAFAATYRQARDLAAAMRKALHGRQAMLSTVPVHNVWSAGERDLPFEEATQTYGRVVDIAIEFDEAQ